MIHVIENVILFYPQNIIVTRNQQIHNISTDPVTKTSIRLNTQPARLKFLSFKNEKNVI